MPGCPRCRSPRLIGVRAFDHAMFAGPEFTSAGADSHNLRIDSLLIAAAGALAVLTKREVPQSVASRYRSLISDVRSSDRCCPWRYAGCMRYAQGGGLTAEGRRRREQVRLEAARRFEQRVPSAVIAAELRVSERSVRRWRQAWQAGGPAGLASRGQAAQCRLDEQQLAALDLALEAGPLAAGWTDQRWTLARVRDLVARKFRVQYAIPGSGTCCAAAAGPASWARGGPSSVMTARSRCGRRKPGRG